MEHRVAGYPTVWFGNPAMEAAVSRDTPARPVSPVHRNRVAIGRPGVIESDFDTRGNTNRLLSRAPVHLDDRRDVFDGHRHRRRVCGTRIVSYDERHLIRAVIRKPQCAWTTRVTRSEIEALESIIGYTGYPQGVTVGIGRAGPGKRAPFTLAAGCWSGDVRDGRMIRMWTHGADRMVNRQLRYATVVVPGRNLDRVTARRCVRVSGARIEGGQDAMRRERRRGHRSIFPVHLRCHRVLNACVLDPEANLRRRPHHYRACRCHNV